ncbi:hypothetical protein J4214_01695 [Candidatus Woesearchaeota archaeon]|nr:hypothetical protein [Candidatus Woesearchaeota archaeon]
MAKILETKTMDFAEQLFELRLIKYDLTDRTHTKKSMVKKVILKRVK